MKLKTEFYDDVSAQPNYIRMGQALMSSLHKFYPELYNEITGTQFDPFYNDKRIIDFWYYINNISEY